MNQASLSLKLRQTQQLNQNLHQSLRVLHMSAQALEAEVAVWLADNPFLEMQDADEHSEALSPSQYTKPAQPVHVGGDEAADIWATVADEPGFFRRLHAQVCEHPLDLDTAARVHLLIDSLNEQGYLADSLSDIADNTPLQWMLDEDNLGVALAALQRFDPPGIGARDLRESLLLQLARLTDDDTNRCASELVRHHLGQWQSARQQKQLQRALPQFRHATVQAALKRIAALNPYPTYGQTGNRPTIYVQPDILIRAGKRGWLVEPARAAWPQLRLNADYAELMNGVELDPACKSKWQEAQTHLDSLLQRQTTVLRLAEWIVAQQQDFFAFGPIGLMPLTLKQAAQALSLAESTISRAVNQKYLACPRGVFALRYFFNQAVAQSPRNSTGSSSLAIKTLLAALIAEEAPNNPYSDAELTAQLAKQDITLARRTVAKYREALKIAPAHQRKHSGQCQC